MGGRRRRNSVAGIDNGLPVAMGRPITHAHRCRLLILVHPRGRCSLLSLVHSYRDLFSSFEESSGPDKNRNDI